METGAPRWVERDELNRDPAMQDFVQSRSRGSAGVERRRRAIELGAAPVRLPGRTRRLFVNRRPNTVFAFAYAARTNASPMPPATCSNTRRRGNWSPYSRRGAEGQGTRRPGLYRNPVRRDAAGARLAGFSLEGTKMRRLRYQIGHYEKHGQCETREYSAAAIRRPTDCRRPGGCMESGKKQIGPYVDHFRGRIAGGICPVIAACSSPTAMGSSTMPS